MRELERRCPPEVRNRIDEVVLFAPLSHDEVREISKHYLSQVESTLHKAGKSISISDEALEHIVAAGYSMAFGARFLKRVIDEKVKLPLSERWHQGTHFEVALKDGELRVDPAPARLVSPDRTLAFGDVA